MIKVCNTYGLDDLPLGTKGRVMALGLFDGVHQGHTDIIRKAVATAERDGLVSTVQTFKNLNKSGTRPLYTAAERLKLIEDTGADELLVRVDLLVHLYAPVSYGYPPLPCGCRYACHG